MSYRFHVHTAKPQFRLVLQAGDPFPPQTRAEAWTFTRERAADDVNADVKAEIAAKGYSLFKIGVAFDEIGD